MAAREAEATMFARCAAAAQDAVSVARNQREATACRDGGPVALSLRIDGFDAGEQMVFPEAF